MEKRITEYTIVTEGKTLFDESATVIRIEDETGGEFVTLVQNGERVETAFDESDWPIIRDTIDEMIGNCREYPI